MTNSSDQAGFGWPGRLCSRIRALPPWQRNLLIFGSVALLYYLAGRWALQVLREAEGVAVFWPASGLAAGLIFVLPRGARVPIALAVVAATAFANLEQRSPSIIAVFSFCNAIECLIFGEMMRRLDQAPAPLETLTSVWAFLAAGMVAACLAAIPAALSLSGLGMTSSPVWKVWLTWFLSDGLGIAAVAPMIMTLPKLLRTKIGRLMLVEGALLAAATGVVAYYAFQAVYAVSMSPFTPTTFLLPFFLLLAGRTPALFSAIAAFLVCVAIVVTALAGRDTAFAGSLEARLDSAQAAIITVVVAALILSAMFARLKNAAEALHSSEQRLQFALAAGEMYAFDLDFERDKVHRSGGLLKRLRLRADGNMSEYLSALHPDDRAAFEAKMFSFSPAGPDVTHRHRMLSADGGYLSIEFRSRGEFDSSGRLVRVCGICADVTEREKAHEALEQREAQLRSALSAGRSFAFEYDLVKREVRRSDNAAEVLGLPLDVVRRSDRVFIDYIHPDDKAALQNYPRQFSVVRPFTTHKFRFIRPDGEVVWLDMLSTGIFDDSGNLVKIRGLSSDVTARTLAEQQREALVEELDHRVKNALARVAVVVDLSREGHQSVDEYYDVIRGRIDAMAKTQERLSRNKWTGVDMVELVADELEAYRHNSNCRISGPSLVLEPDTAQSFAFTIHELATNAAKYGGLATPKSGVDVEWREMEDGDGKRRLELDWRERAERRIEPPTRESYGLDTIRNLLRYEKRAKVDLDFTPTGLHCRIVMPLPARLAEGAGAFAPATSPPEVALARR